MEQETNSIPAYQLDRAGLLVITDIPQFADESPEGPAGVYHIPAGCITVAPPETWPEKKWPRWNGSKWELVNKPRPPAAIDPVEKLRRFLENNPDVAALLNQ